MYIYIHTYVYTGQHFRLNERLPAPKVSAARLPNHWESVRRDAKDHIQGRKDCVSRVPHDCPNI